MEDFEYYSCNIIEHGFDAQIDSINLCCRAGNEKITQKEILIPNYKGEKIDWNKFSLLKENIKNLQKEGNSVPQCLGCVYLEKKNWDNEQYINSININNWIKCNANCIYCDRKFYKNKKEYNIYPIIKDLINNNLLRNPTDITIAGGEPTITSDFDKTLKLLIKNKIKQVRILTNGIKYNRYIQEGLKKNLINILISTDSGTRETYYKIKLVDKHKDVWKNIKNYAKNQAETTLVKTKYIIIPHINGNRTELKEFIEQNKIAGVKQTYIDVEIGTFANKCKDEAWTKGIYELYEYTKELGQNNDVEVLPFDRIKILENKFKTN